MDDLDRQLAELQLITKGELKQNPNNSSIKPKKIGPAVPPKPKKPQVYSNVPTIGVPKPFEKPLNAPPSGLQHQNTYANQDGLIYSNILHEVKPVSNLKSNSNFNNSNRPRNDELPPPPLDISPDYIQCNVPNMFPPSIPNEDDDLDILPPPPPLVTDSQPLQMGGNIIYTPMDGNGKSSGMHKAYPQAEIGNSSYNRQSPTSYHSAYNYNENNFYANFNKAQPQVPTNYKKSYKTYNNYSNIPDPVPTYENTIMHGNINEHDYGSEVHNSVLNYPGSSVSDYENQAQVLENRGKFRVGSSASNYVPGSDYERENPDSGQQPFRSASSASNYAYERYNDQSESLYAPLRRPNDNDLPPPPPIMGDKSHSPNLPPIIICGRNNAADEIPPPASPVSSSYSELRRATDIGSHHHGMFNPYTPPSHISSTYESIYEPINLRPSSQNSARSSGYSLYGTHQNSSLTGNKQAKELEVDQLTDLLVQGLDSADQDDVYGICVKCNEKIVGEENGCTAMDNFYHIDCFTCCQCNSNLQGKPFYSLEGQPYCEQDYLNTLEKCSVCVKPILDRILRATGKPYHPQCFTCIVCNKSLDGVPFTVDATNQIHCIEDFHKKFAPRCCVCKLPIMPEQGEEETVRVVALDRSFHIGCYKCEDCGLVLSSEAEGKGCYPLDDHVLCKSCNAKRVQALTSHMTTEL